MQRIPLLIIAILILCLVFPGAGQAQEAEETPQLTLSRDFGYGGGQQIQGTFSFKIRNPDRFVQVEFLIDGEIIHTDQEAPFQYQFRTESYGTGFHTLTAIAYQADGTALESNRIVREFVTSEQAWNTVGKMIVPILVVVGGITVLGFVIPLLSGRKQGFKPGVYGIAGGAICPRCQFPYARHVLAPNLLLGKLERCPHCGKWAIVAAASQANLKAAEERWAYESQGSIATPTEAEKMSRAIDESRYQD